MNEGKLRREALQIAIQLPSDQAEALRVLTLTEGLVRGFLQGAERDAGGAADAAQAPLRLVPLSCRPGRV